MITNQSYKLLKNLQQFCRKFLHNKYNYKMNKAYLRHLNETNQFQLTFQYTNQNLKVNKEFNFCRPASESVESFLARVSTNIEKVVNKKRKDQEPILITPTLYLDNTEVSSKVKCVEIFKENSNKTIKLSLMNEEFTIVVNSPWINSLGLSKAILANYPTNPSRIISMYTDFKLSDYKWFKSKDKKNWVNVGSSLIYVPSNDDIGCYLKFVCTPKNSTQEGPSIEAVSRVGVEADPGLSPFELRYELAKQRTPESVFRVVSYNILADVYCDSDYTRQVLHPYCPEYALMFDYRKQLIMKELLGYNADVICLQEVDQRFYNSDLQMILTHLGYDGNYCGKSGTTAEGLACFYNNKKFKLLQTQRMVLSENINTNPIFSDLSEKITKNQNLWTRILDRSNVLQVTILECLDSGKILIVANTHLYFHPDADHIRLIQAGIIIRYLEHFIKDLNKLYENRTTSLVFCGDFNSVPECGIFKLLTTGFVPENCIDFQSNKEEVVEGLSLKQPFNLDSACGTPQFTNFTTAFSACLDYIFYEKDKLSVEQIFPFPSIEELTQHTALPSVVFPSDHVSLVCDLKWR